MTKNREHNYDGTPKWWGAVVLMSIILLAAAIWFRLHPRGNDDSDSSHNDSSSLSSTAKDNEPVQLLKSLSERWSQVAADQGVSDFNSQQSIRRMLKEREHFGLAGASERDELQVLNSPDDDAAFAGGPIVRNCLKAISNSYDSGVFLDPVPGLEQDNGNSRFREVWNRWFKEVDYDTTSGCRSRRMLMERLADLLAIDASVDTIRSINIDQQQHPFLYKAQQLKARQLRSSFYDLQDDAVGLVFPSDCVAAEAISQNWIAESDRARRSSSFNPVDALSASDLSRLKRELQVERDRPIEGLSHDDQARVQSVYGSLQQLFDNERVRADRISSKKWSKSKLEEALHESVDDLNSSRDGIPKEYDNAVSVALKEIRANSLLWIEPHSPLTPRLAARSIFRNL